MSLRKVNWNRSIRESILFNVVAITWLSLGVFACVSDFVGGFISNTFPNVTLEFVITRFERLSENADFKSYHKIAWKYFALSSPVFAVILLSTCGIKTFGSIKKGWRSVSVFVVIGLMGFWGMFYGVGMMQPESTGFWASVFYSGAFGGVVILGALSLVVVYAVSFIVWKIVRKLGITA